MESSGVSFGLLPALTLGAVEVCRSVEIGSEEAPLVSGSCDEW
jgi:hypothetical protein